jgi:hypothetical protein
MHDDDDDETMSSSVPDTNYFHMHEQIQTRPDMLVITYYLSQNLLKYGQHRAAAAGSDI